MRCRLVLVRHAKAEGAHLRGDHERVLLERGVDAAVGLGRWLAQQELSPERVLVSTAVRARQTLDALQQGQQAAGAPGDAPTWPDRRIYDGGVDGVLAAVSETPEEVEVLWVVGHEPVMSTTAWELAHADDVPDHLRHELSSGLPTASAAVLETDVSWDELGFGGARLVALHTG